MLGIDVSNWDSDRELIVSDIDFLIAKCSEGTYFYDYSFESFVRSAHDCKCLTGAYHFAGDCDPCDEAQYFYDKVKYYLNICIPFLDYENFTVDATYARSWCEQFISHFYELSGVWCGLYCSASICHWFSGSWIPDKCVLWVAGYPSEDVQYSVPAEYCPYDVNPWVRPFIWQFTNALFVGDKNKPHGNIFDGNICYYDKATWVRKLSKDEPPSPEPDDEDYLHMACRVILGEYGIGEARKNAINECGFDYDKVQNLVNEIMELMGDE